MIKLYLITTLLSIIGTIIGSKRLAYICKDNKYYEDSKLIGRYRKKHRSDSYIIGLKIKSNIQLLFPIWNIILALVMLLSHPTDDVLLRTFRKVLKEISPHVRQNYPELVSEKINEDKRNPEFHVIKDLVNS